MVLLGTYELVEVDLYLWLFIVAGGGLNKAARVGGDIDEQIEQ